MTTWNRFKELQGEPMFCLKFELKAPFTQLKFNLEFEINFSLNQVVSQKFTVDLQML